MFDARIGPRGETREISDTVPSPTPPPPSRRPAHIRLPDDSAKHEAMKRALAGTGIEVEILRPQ